MTQELKLDVIKFLFLNTFPAIAIVNENPYYNKAVLSKFLNSSTPISDCLYE